MQFSMLADQFFFNVVSSSLSFVVLSEVGFVSKFFFEIVSDSLVYLLSIDISAWFLRMFF